MVTRFSSGAVVLVSGTSQADLRNRESQGPLATRQPAEIPHALLILLSVWFDVSWSGLFVLPGFTARESARPAQPVKPNLPKPALFIAWTYARLDEEQQNKQGPASGSFVSMSRTPLGAGSAIARQVTFRTFARSEVSESV